jgi:hypothetical protein
MAARTCRICGRTDPACAWLSQGRCPMCHMYWKRHGVERPPQQPRPRAGGWPPAMLRPCTHCGRLTLTPSRGRCRACYSYWRRHHVERPAAGSRRAAAPRPATPARARAVGSALPPYRGPSVVTRPCRICGRRFPPEYDFSQGRCRMCARYWARNGVERPLDRGLPPVAAPRACAHCAGPTARPKRGRCDACYRYWLKYGRERPARLWQRR